VFTPNTVPSLYINPGSTSSTIVGITNYTADCSKTNYVYTTSPDPTFQNSVPSGGTIQIQNTIPNVGANTLGIQFYKDTLLSTIAVVNGNVDLIVVPPTATYFTATASYLYNILNPAVDNYEFAYNGSPLLFVNTNVLTENTQTITVQYFNSLGFFIDDAVQFTPSSPQTVLVSSAPGSTSFLKLRVQV
jgi:hypothetical protein